MDNSIRTNQNYIIIVMASLLVVVLLYLFSSFLFVGETEFENQIPKQTQSNFYPIVRAIDGDTIVVKIEGRDETIRLIGIDTPETVDPRRSVECFGREASDRAKEVLNGKSVRLERDEMGTDRDKYGRSLRYLFLDDDTNFNETMIKEGYAYEYTYENALYKYQNEFKQAEEYARENKRGLWADGVCK